MLLPMQDRKQYIDHILHHLPAAPGIYKMKDQEGKIIYIGKAINLLRRVSGYFQESRNHSQRTRKMIEQVADIDYTVVQSNLEAMILETNLIKELRPKYNILMKDDKNYVYLKITVNELYPKIFLTRKVQNDKAKYFGPKTSAHKVIKTLKLLNKIFPYRNCSLALDYTVNDSGQKPELSVSQLNYHQKHCLGPCILSVTPEEYRKSVQEIINFFEGKYDDIIARAKAEMLSAASHRKFEVAAAIRDKMAALESIMEKQRISEPTLRNIDIINYTAIEDKIYFVLFQLRQGKLVSQDNFTLAGSFDQSDENRDGLEAFLSQYYEKAADIPDEILIPNEIDEQETINSWLTEIAGHKVSITIPERGRKNNLLSLALENAVSYAKQAKIKWQGINRENRENALRELQDLLALPAIPRRLECYDISHLGGTNTVSSMVVFENGFPKKSDYRHFKLRKQTPGEPNDFFSIYETLTRRLKYLKPSLLNREFKIKILTKKELEKVQNQLQDVNTEKKKIFGIYKDKQLISTAILNETISGKWHLEKITNIDQLEIFHLIKGIAEKIKTKRLYLTVGQDLIKSFEDACCEIVHKLPAEMTIEKNEQLMIFDKLKYRDDRSFRAKPDLIIIDGGKGQLTSARQALKEADLCIPVVSLAKQNEEIFLPESKNPLQLAKTDPIIHLFQHIRDESHRFALSYNRNLRLNSMTSSVLDDIQGLGVENRKRLLRHFGSVAAIGQASLQEIAAVTGVSLAKKIKEKLGFY